MTEFFAFMQTPQFWTALGAIILIDLVLAGDNAILIALAARNLPPDLQRKAILWGTAGAIAMRVLMTVIVVWLLKIPGLMAIGGLALLYIAVQLIVPDQDSDHADGPSATTLLGAMKTIVIADALMGLDNVLGVAGAAGGSMALVVIGLLISIPIVVWASSFVLTLIEKFPITIYIGAAVLAATSAKMITSEKLLSGLFNAGWIVKAPVYLVCVGLVLWLGHLLAKKAKNSAQSQRPDQKAIDQAVAS